MAVITSGHSPSKARVNRFFIILFSLYAILVLRLVYMQIIHGEFTRSRAFSARTKVVSKPVPRADVVDSNGKVLITNSFTETLIADPKLIKNPAVTASRLAECLHKKPEELVGILTPVVKPIKVKDKTGKIIVINRTKGDIHVIEKLDPADAVQLSKLMHDKPTRSLFEGLRISRTPERKFMFGSAAGVVLGNATIRRGENSKSPEAANIDRLSGRFGVEAAFDEQLAGKIGTITGEYDANGPIPNTETVTVLQVDGKAVQLTIDIDIQMMVEAELQTMCNKYHPVRATAIVLEPKTGAILAMASYPPLDPSNFRHLNPVDPGFQNVALSEFEPGSTMKAVTACAALDDGLITTNSHWFCNGSVEIGGHKVKCVLHGAAATNGGHLDESIFGVIGNSCNVATSLIGQKMGMQRMDQWLSAFHFLEPNGISLRADQKGRLNYTATDRLSSSKAARVAFGQSVMVTPLSMAVAYAIIANDGKFVAPRLVKAYLGERGKPVQTFAPDAGKQILKPQTASTVNKLLQYVVTNGTGKGIANVPGYTVAGKTGTAQRVDETGHYNQRMHVASFAGFLPATNPRAVVYVLADTPEGEGWGSQVAGPCFQKIAQKLMVKLNVPMDDPSSASRAIAKN